MHRIAIAFVFSLAASGAALACDGHKSSTATAAAGAETAKAEGKHCDMPAATASTATLPAEGKRVKLAVSGMSCGSCATKVQTALMGVEGVKGAVVDATTGVAEIAYDEKKTNADKLVAAVAGTKHFTATVATN